MNGPLCRGTRYVELSKTSGSQDNSKAVENEIGYSDAKEIDVVTSLSCRLGRRNAESENQSKCEGDTGECNTNRLADVESARQWCRRSLGGITAGVVLPPDGLMKVAAAGLAWVFVDARAVTAHGLGRTICPAVHAAHAVGAGTNRLGALGDCANMLRGGYALVICRGIVVIFLWVRLAACVVREGTIGKGDEFVDIITNVAFKDEGRFAGLVALLAETAT